MLAKHITRQQKGLAIVSWAVLQYMRERACPSVCIYRRAQACGLLSSDIKAHIRCHDL